MSGLSDIYSILEPGETRNITGDGDWFFLIESPEILTVRINNGNRLRFKAGMIHKPERRRVTHVSITNESQNAITVLAYIGSGVLEDNSVQLSGAVEVSNFPQPPAIQQVQFAGGNDAPVEQIHKVGASFTNLYGVGVGHRKLIDAATNQHGAILRTCLVNENSGFAAVQVSVNAPSMIHDPTIPKIVYTNAVKNTTPVPLPVLIPAGQGLWYSSSASSSHCHVSYDFLGA